MTREQREQAARTLQEFYDFNKTLTPQGDSWLQADITINRYTQEELGKALPTAIDALRGPQPDPITGLMPCGCGGSPVIVETKSKIHPFIARCPLCYMQTDSASSEEDAQFFWNHGMGGNPFPLKNKKDGEL